MIGLDLDNTIIDYDAACRRVGWEIGLLPETFTGGKRAVRDYLRSGPQGDAGWQRLQAELYGLCINYASLSPGVAAFILDCRRSGHDVAIISHKTEYAAAAPNGANLRECARIWLNTQRFNAAEGVSFSDIPLYFADSRADKLALIETLGCAWFVDDLPEVLLDPVFPSGTNGLHFALHPDDQLADPRLQSFSSWPAVARHIFADVKERHD